MQSVYFLCLRIPFILCIYQDIKDIFCVEVYGIILIIKWEFELIIVKYVSTT